MYNMITYISILIKIAFQGTLCGMSTIAMRIGTNVTIMPDQTTIGGND